MQTPENLSALAQPFPSALVSWRVGLVNESRTSGQALPYLDARVIMDRFDEVVGIANWEDAYEEVIVGNRIVAVRCTITVDVGGKKVSKEDAAQLDVVSEKATEAQARRVEIAVKGVYSDAFKRAAVKWGVGRYLYAFRAPWVKLTDHGLLSAIPRLPDQMLPEAERKQGQDGGGGEEPMASTQQEIQAEAEVPAEMPAEPSEKVAEAVQSKAAVAQEPAAQEPAPEAAQDKSTGAAVGTVDKSSAQAANEDQLSDFAKSILSKIGNNGMDKATLLQYVNSPRCRAKLAEGEHAVVVSRIQAAA